MRTTKDLVTFSTPDNLNMKAKPAIFWLSEEINIPSLQFFPMKYKMCNRSSCPKQPPTELTSSCHLDLLYAVHVDSATDHWISSAREATLRPTIAWGTGFQDAPPPVPTDEICPTAIETACQPHCSPLQEHEQHRQKNSNSDTAELNA